MNRGYPSMTALLGLLAIAGYQNRDKIADMLGGTGKGTTGAGQQSNTGGIGSWFEQFKTAIAGTSAGGFLSGGLGELVDRFKQSGHGEVADSWVKTGPNKPCTASQLEQAIGPDVMENLAKQTGLSRSELAERLCRELPAAVDKYTPQGRLPTEAEMARS
jgi:uncharacterized protein YidB (DUF937 family)